MSWRAFVNLIEGGVEAGKLAAGALVFQRATQEQESRLRNVGPHPPMRHVLAAYDAVHEAARASFRARDHALDLSRGMHSRPQHITSWNDALFRHH